MQIEAENLIIKHWTKILLDDYLSLMLEIPAISSISAGGIKARTAADSKKSANIEIKIKERNI